MLKQLPQPSESPASPPRFHYVPTSRSSPASPFSSRRPSKPTPPALASRTVQTQTQAVKYVDVGTQWSPMMSTKINPAPPEQMRIETAPQLEPLAWEPPAPKIVCFWYLLVLITMSQEQWNVVFECFSNNWTITPRVNANCSFLGRRRGASFSSKARPGVSQRKKAAIADSWRKRFCEQ